MFILPQQIDRIMETTFTPEGVIRLNQLEQKDFGEIPLLRQVQCLCRHIRSANGLLKLQYETSMNMFFTQVHD